MTQDIAPIKKAYYDSLAKKADGPVKKALNPTRNICVILRNRSVYCG